MENFARDKNYKFVIYAGDGGNDFCPMLKLSSNDLAFVRKNYALERTISKMKQKRGLEIQAKIIYWENCHGILEEIKNKLTEF